MAAELSAFGYTVPLTVVLVAVALVVGLALVVQFWLTIGLSVYRSVQNTRRQRVREDLQAQLLDGVFDPDADWSEWVAGLSSVERDVTESLLDEYLRELDGQQVEALQDLGDELAIPERSRRHLERRGEYRRLYALTWLTLLNRPDRLRAAEFRPQTARERAAVARLRYETDDLDDPAEGLSLLLDGANAQFTVFGQDTLYRIATDDPGELFEAGVENYRTWPDQLLIQVLVVGQHLGTGVTTEDLSWLAAALEHENEAVRAAAARALGNVGWRTDVRDRVFLDRLRTDQSPRVRGAVYQMFARWGDEHALAALADGLRSEDDPRTRLTGTDALVGRRDRLEGDVPDALANAWAWSREQAEYDRVARQRSTQVSG